MSRPSSVAPIDRALSALSALSAGFLAFAMPDALFSRIIVASQVPQFLAAAQPPLGLKARLAVVLLVAIVAYALVWTLLRAIDKAAEPIPTVDEAEDEDAPRLRRADAHPDAPARRPLLAARDLGEPEDEYTLDQPVEEHWLDTLPASPEPVAEHEDFEQPRAFEEPEAIEEPPEAPDTFEAPAPFEEPVQSEQEAEAAEPPDSTDWMEEPSPLARKPERIPAFLVRQDEAEAPAAAEPIDEEVEEEETADESDSEIEAESLARLMSRFESGLSRKQPALPQVEGTAGAFADPNADRMRHRLRSAISDLNRISARGR